jgi:glycosyltransferase involved in cell wall biosynthesis
MMSFGCRFADWKRLDCLLNAAVKYEERMAKEGHKVITIVAGSGPLESQKLYMDMKNNLGLSSSVFFVGPQPQPVLAKLYTVADVGVFPSYEEPVCGPDENYSPCDPPQGTSLY